MAKGDVVLKFDAQTAAFVANVLKAKDGLDKGADSARKFGEAGVKTGDQFSKGMASVGSSVQSAVAGILGFTSALALMEKAATERLDNIKNKAEKMKASVDSIMGSLATAGRTNEYGRVRSELQGMVTPDAGIQELEQIFRQVTTNVPKATTTQHLAAVKVGARGLGAGRTPESAAALASIHAELTASGAYKNAKPEDMASRAERLAIDLPGGLSERQLKALGESDDPDAMLNLIIASTRAHEQRAMPKLIDAARTDYTKPGAIRTAQDAKLSKIPAGQRMAAMMADTSLFGDDQEAAESVKKNLKDFMGEAVSSQALVQAEQRKETLDKTNPEAKAKARSEFATRQEDIRKRAGGVDALNEEAYWQWYATERKKNSMLSGGFHDAMIWTGRALGNHPDAANMELFDRVQGAAAGESGRKLSPMEQAWVEQQMALRGFKVNYQVNQSGQP